jgi:DNA (cytosine-5)-methyltransferase 1
LESLPPPDLAAPSVFSIFACGGGSSMGYKLAGMRTLGYCEIDPQMSAIYDRNIAPSHRFKIPVQEFNALGTWPDELRALDVLDGSPPCSVFSMAGAREAKWGSEHAFREGQATQRLDDLFLHFVRTAKLLRPKAVVAENVTGMLAGNARGYVAEVFDAFDAAGYDAQLFKLCASKMGVPQRRNRVVFVARRRDLSLPPLALAFDEPEIACSAAIAGCVGDGKRLTRRMAWLWSKVLHGGGLHSVHPRGSLFSWRRLNPLAPASTLTATDCTLHWVEPRHLSRDELVRLQSFPDDYDFLDTDPAYVVGMSVPPLMMQRLALELRKQWLG